MSKTIIASVSALAIGIIIAGGYYWKSHTDKNPLPILTTEVTPILLYPESGDVEYKLQSNGIFQKATSSPTIIANQTIVHTGVGHASVLLPDNSMISLSDNTEVTVTYTKSKTSIYQSFGLTYHRVQALLSGSSYQVQTPGTLAAVRGTKFAVGYSSSTKKTKVSVTEHEVQVSATGVNAQGTSTSDGVSVGEGKTAIVQPTLNAQTSIQTTDTKSDTEMKVWVNTNKVIDTQVDTLKKSTGDTTDFRLQLRNVLFKDDSKTIETKNIEPEINQINQKTESTTKEQTVNKKTEEITETSSTKKVVPVEQITKMDEDEFYSKFNDMFINYFYLDDSDTPCGFKVTPEERVRLVTAYATKNGYPFTSTTLLSFAQAVDSYCAQKNADTKVKLQARFDIEFPYKQAI